MSTPSTGASAPCPRCGKPMEPCPAQHTDQGAYARCRACHGHFPAPAMTAYVSIWTEVQAERERAHAKHGDTSMESQPPTAWLRLAILMEEVGEVAKVYNDARHRAQSMGWNEADMFSDLAEAELRAELIQVAAMAGAWADALTASGDEATP